MIPVPKERLLGGGESSSDLLDVGKTGWAGRRWKQHTPGGRDVKGKGEEVGRPGSHLGIPRRTAVAVAQEWGKQPQQEGAGMSVTVTSGGRAWQGHLCSEVKLAWFKSHSIPHKLCVLGLVT